jgi:glucose-6-phosphate isomerase
MKHLSISKPPVHIKLNNFFLEGLPVINQTRRIKDIASIFKDQKAVEELSPERIAYTVQLYFPVPEGKTGALAFGNTTIFPGKAGNEYFMTKGHFHGQADRAEFYWCIQGKGMLILMDQNRNSWAEEMVPGSLHYIGANTALRVANTGDENLIFGACWPSDAGHNYEEIAINGFSARLFEINNKPLLVSSESER